MMNLHNRIFTNCLRIIAFGCIAFGFFILTTVVAQAASLSVSPSTGVYTSNSVFTVRVLVQPDGTSVNAAEGTLKFNPNELTVVSVNRSSSIFNLWVAEPSFSNSAGTISFSGGSPAGYSGATGNIMNVTFRAKGSGPAKVTFTNGSVLANDGRGTNILSAMSGGNYTLQAAAATPEPEQIEYIAPANTPAAPVISSETHSDPSSWFKEKEAVLSWTLPAGVTQVRTLLNGIPTSVPTKVYDTPIRTITIPDLDEGVSYFHIQFKNEDGWGRVTHYRLAVDSQAPTSIDIQTATSTDSADPVQVLQLQVEDETSAVDRYFIKIDSDDGYEYIDETGSSTVVLPALPPGYHSVIIEAFDQAGNSVIGTHSFTIEAFDKPIFTTYPTEMNAEVIPVIKGMTRANAQVTVALQKIGSEARVYEITSDENGEFIFIPEGTLENGVYQLTARATDVYGAQSETSDPVRIAVQQPGYLQIGSFIVSILSVLIPLLLLLFLLVMSVWYMFTYMRRFRKKVRVESTEALTILHQEFASLQSIVEQQEEQLRASRKTKKLTKAEAQTIAVFSQALSASQSAVEKEIEDVTELTDKKK